MFRQIKNKQITIKILSIYIQIYKKYNQIFGYNISHTLSIKK